MSPEEIHIRLRGLDDLRDTSGTEPRLTIYKGPKEKKFLHFDHDA